MLRKKRKLSNEEHSCEPICIGSLQKCPYGMRTSQKKMSQAGQRNITETDSDGNFIFKEKTVINERYELFELVGKGGFGIAVKAYDKEQKKEVVVIKIIQNTEDSHADGIKEVRTLKKLAQLDPDDKYACARLLNSFCCGGHICLVFPVYGVSVRKFYLNIRCAAYRLNEVRHIGYQLCCAIKFLHENCMIHADIKPDNILFVNGSLNASSSLENDNFDIRLIDFGSVTTENEFRIVARTQSYSAPEHILKIQNGYGYDIWSIGCTIFEMYVGQQLFQQHSSIIVHLASIERIVGKLPSHLVSLRPKIFRRNGTVKLDRRTRVSRELHNRLILDDFKLTETDEEKTFFKLIKSMLEIDPKKRICIHQVLSHEFFANLLPKKDDGKETEIKDNDSRK